jgi:hypothetical protein
VLAYGVGRYSSCSEGVNMCSKSPAQRIPIALRRGLIHNFLDCVDRICARILHLVRDDVEPSMYLLFTCRANPVRGCGSAVEHDLAPMRTRQTHVSSVNKNIYSPTYFKPVERSASLPGSPLLRHCWEMSVFDHCIHHRNLDRRDDSRELTSGLLQV